MIKVNEKRILLIDIIAVGQVIEKGNKVFVVDAFYEGKNPFFSIKTEKGIQEIGFKVKENGFANDRKLRKFLDTVSMPDIFPNHEKVTVVMKNGIASLRAPDYEEE